MRTLGFQLTILAIIPCLWQCEMGSAPQTNVVTGPFDSRGNYIEDWVDKPHKWYKPTAPTSQPKPTGIASAPPSIPDPEPTIAVVKPDSTATAQYKPKPTQVSAKPKPKPAAPSSVTHTVRKGDTLSGIASKYRSSVSKIQRANGLRGTVIRIGQRLKVPR